TQPRSIGNCTNCMQKTFADHLHCSFSQRRPTRLSFSSKLSFANKLTSSRNSKQVSHHHLFPSFQVQVPFGMPPWHRANHNHLPPPSFYPFGSTSYHTSSSVWFSQCRVALQCCCHERTLDTRSRLCVASSGDRVRFSRGAVSSLSVACIGVGGSVNCEVAKGGIRDAQVALTMVRRL